MEEARIADVMTEQPIVVSPDTPILEVAKLLIDSQIGGIPVVDDDGGLVGIITDGDLIMQDIKLQFPSYIQFIDGVFLSPMAVSKFEDRLRKAIGANVEDVMTSDVVTVGPEDTVADAATLMVENRVSRVPVVSEGRVVGIVTKADIVKSMLA